MLVFDSRTSKQKFEVTSFKICKKKLIVFERFDIHFGGVGVLIEKKNGRWEE
jgi:hypothetical protein